MTKKSKPENFGSIVVSNKDTLIFDYSFYSNSPEKSAFLFKIVLKNNNEENINNTNNKTVKYFGLPEGNYIFTVSVFDPRNSVSASPMQISFRVNNNEAKLLKEIAELKEKAKQKDTLKPEVKTGDENRRYRYYFRIDRLIGIFSTMCCLFKYLCC